MKIYVVKEKEGDSLIFQNLIGPKPCSSPSEPLTLSGVSFDFYLCRDMDIKTAPGI